jgi:hypothetical protein
MLEWESSKEANIQANNNKAGVHLQYNWSKKTLEGNLYVYISAYAC